MLGPQAVGRVLVLACGHRFVRRPEGSDSELIAVPGQHGDLHIRLRKEHLRAGFLDDQLEEREVVRVA